jgi:hypothetical protein
MSIGQPRSSSVVPSAYFQFRNGQSTGFKTAKTGVGLAHRVGSFRPIAFTGFGDVPGIKEQSMKNETLKNSIATLQKLRDVYYSQLDAGALAELDDVLQQLRDMLEGSERRGLEHDELVFRALRVIDVFVQVVSNITGWMK